MDRMLNMCYAIEVVEGRLNGSSDEIEKRVDGYNNTTFTKKIGGRAMVSAVCQKYNIKNFMETVCGYEQNIKKKEGKQIKSVVNPQKFADDDLFGFMLATNEVITEKEFKELSKEEQSLFKKDSKGNKYTADTTKKRVSRIQMSPLINISSRKVQLDFHTCSSSTNSLPYKLQTYAGIMSGIANINIGQIGKFNISNDSTEFRDYTILDLKDMEVKDLDKKEKIKRIESVLRGIEYLSIKGNQTNHLTDTKPKFIIMADYSWGNNVFQGLINENGINIEMLKESLEQNKGYKLGKVYIGINQFFDEIYNNIKETLQEELKDYDFIEITDVHTAFNSYIDNMKEILENQ